MTVKVMKVMKVMMKVMMNDLGYWHAPATCIASSPEAAESGEDE